MTSAAATSALVPYERGCCPSCGTVLVEVVAEEPALFYHGGYGATRQTVTAFCTSDRCSWWMVRSVSEVRPEGSDV